MSTRPNTPTKKLRPREHIPSGFSNRLLGEMFVHSGEGDDASPADILQGEESKILARIIGAGADAIGKAYAWVLVVRRPDGGYQDWYGTEAGGSSSTSLPAYARNGNPRVPLDGSALVELELGPNGDHYLFDWDARPVWGQIGSGSGGKYAWAEVTPAANGTWAAMSNGLSGTTSVNPAIEMSLNTAVTSGTKVRLWRGFCTKAARVVCDRNTLGDGSANEIQSVYVEGAISGTFTLTLDQDETTAAIAYNANAAAVEAALEALTAITAVTVTGSGTFSSPFLITFEDDEDEHILTPDIAALKGDQEWLFTRRGLGVREVDTSPSYVNIQTIEFDQADGFVVTNPGTGVARVDQTAASTTTVGYVTTGTQSFSGEKTFDGRTNGDDIPLIVRSREFGKGQEWRTNLGVAQARVDLGGAIQSSSGFYVGDVSTNDFPSYYGIGAGFDVGETVGLIGHEDGDTLQLHLDPNNDRLVLENSWGGGFYGAAKYSVRTGVSAVIADGVYGVTMGGDSVSGGIITTIGTDEISVGSGGSGSNMSATGPGYVVQLTAGANFSSLLFKLDAMTAPTVNDDSADGYGVGSMWVNLSTDIVYICTDASVGAAVWAQTSYSAEQAQDAVGGILTDTATIDLTYDDAGGAITADVKANSLTAGFLHASATDVLFGRSTASAGAGEEIVCTSYARSLLDDTTAAGARGTLGATTVGGNFFTLTNPSAITFPRINADNTVSALDAATFRTAIGAGTATGDVTAASNFGTDNRLLRSDGVLKGAQASGVTCDDSDNISGVGVITVSSVKIRSSGSVDQLELKVTGSFGANFAWDLATNGNKSVAINGDVAITGNFSTAAAVTFSGASALTFTIGGTSSLTLPTGTRTLVARDSTDTLSNKTLNAAKIASGDFIADENGNEQIMLATTASAITYVKFQNNSTGNAPVFSVDGETNVSLQITAKGTGHIQLQPNGGPVLVGGAAAASPVRLFEPSGGGSSYVALVAPALSADLTLTLPAADAAGPLCSNGSGTLAFNAFATQTNQEAGTSTTNAVTPSVQHFHESACKAWICLNGTGTAAIKSDYNFSGITDNGTGDYTLTIDTDLANGNYAAVQGVTGPAATGGQIMGQHDTVVKSGSAYRIFTLNGAGTSNTDCPDISVALFGDI